MTDKEANCTITGMSMLHVDDDHPRSSGRAPLVEMRTMTVDSMSTPEPNERPLSRENGEIIGTSVSGAFRGIPLVKYDQLLAVFECPVCKNLVSPPIPQCRKGHIVCNGCLPKLRDICPICKQRFANTNNTKLEDVAKAIAFPCRYRLHGCQDVSFLHDRRLHEDYCRYRPTPCVYASRGCNQVLLFKEMDEHVRNCSHHGSGSVKLTNTNPKKKKS